MNSFRQGSLVALRELKERSRSRAFRVSVAVMVLAVAVMIIVPSALKTSTTKDVGLTGSVPAGLAQAIKDGSRAVGTTARIHNYAKQATGEEAVRQGHVDLLVVDARHLEWPRTPDQQLRAVVTSAVKLVAVERWAAAAGVTPQALQAVLAPVPLDNVQLGSVAGRGPDDENAAFVMSGLMVLAISAYGGLVLSGVVEEKSSRVVEVLLARVPARNLLAGKVAGIGLLGLAQVGVTALGALVAITAVGSFDIPGVRGVVLAWLVVWFLLGYLLYATMYGALGALASRPEDAQSVAGPAMAVMIASYFAAFFMVRQPYSAFARAISFVPFSAPIAMPNRIAMGAVAWWEPAVSVVVTIGTIAGLVVFAGQVYERAVLHGGPALGLRDVLGGRAVLGAKHVTVPGHLGALVRGALTPVERRTAMANGAHAPSFRATAEIIVAGIAIGALVGLLTNDVILGVIAGGGFIVCLTALLRAWTGHGTDRLGHN